MIKFNTNVKTPRVAGLQSPCDCKTYVKAEVKVIRLTDAITTSGVTETGAKWNNLWGDDWSPFN